MTLEQLKEFDGRGSLVYVGILGKVFDVTEGTKFYGKDAEYSFFAGCDASRSYATGKAEMDNKHIVTDMSEKEIQAVYKWFEFYEKHKDYRYVGKVAGLYYDQNGRATEELRTVLRIVQDGKVEDEKEQEEKEKYPSCNMHWKDKKGKIWCESEHRYPRENNHRCSCYTAYDISQLSDISVIEGCGRKDKICFKEATI